MYLIIIYKFSIEENLNILIILFRLKLPFWYKRSFRRFTYINVKTIYFTKDFGCIVILYFVLFVL